MKRITIEIDSNEDNNKIRNYTARYLLDNFKLQAVRVLVEDLNDKRSDKLNEE